jgi:hypothetical protein
VFSLFRINLFDIGLICIVVVVVNHHHDDEDWLQEATQHIKKHTHTHYGVLVLFHSYVSEPFISVRRLLFRHLCD